MGLDEAENNFISSPLPNYDGIVLTPFKYITSLPSKNIREKITQILNFWAKLPENEMRGLSNVVADLHNASLIIDDIEDGSELRRGFPSTHVVHGLPQSINSANYVYFKAVSDLIKLYPADKYPKVIEVVLKALMDLHVGQGVELFWRDENVKAGNLAEVHIPTETEYYDVIAKKTSRLITLLTDVIAIVSGSETGKQLNKIADLIGTHFQIRDDLLNLISGTYLSAKGFCEDISEGKFSFPIIQALSARRDKEGGLSEEKWNRLLKILRMQTHDKNLKMEALDIIIESGAIKYTKAKVQEFRKEIEVEVKKLGANPVYDKYKNIFDDFF